MTSSRNGHVAPGGSAARRRSVGSLLALSLTPALASGASLPAATYIEQIQGPTQSSSGTSTLLPETIALDDSAGGRQFVAQVITSPGSSTTGSPPMVDLQASGFDAAGNANGTIEYWVGLEPIDPLAPPDAEIPVRVKLRGEASAFSQPTTQFTGSLAGASVSATVWIEPFIAPAISVSAEACDGEADPFSGIEPCPGISNFGALNYATTLQVAADRALRINIGASVLGVAGSDWDADAVVDPFFDIDPTFMLDIGGTLIPATQLYTLVASDGIQVINSPVPLPAATWLFGSALGMLFWARRRR